MRVRIDDAAAFAHGQQRIARDVQQRLDDLVGVDFGIRQGRIVVALHQHAGARFAAQQPVHVLAHLVHVDQRLLRRPRRADHRVDQRREPVGLADDDAGVFAQVFVQLAFQQLRGAAQAAERILDLVRQLANHLAARIEARHQLVLARDALALRGVGDFQQQVLARRTRCRAASW